MHSAVDSGRFLLSVASVVEIDDGEEESDRSSLKMGQKLGFLRCDLLSSYDLLYLGGSG